MPTITIIPETIDAAIAVARRLGVMPTALGSAAARDAFAMRLRGLAVWSARTTNAEYLQAVRDGIARIMQGGRDNDFAQVRLELKELLRALGYDPETGFPGDELLGVPPAEEGGLHDISSTKRIDLVLNQNIRILRGAGQKARGMDADIIDRWPAWELVRAQTRRVPRGTPDSGTIGWQRRWVIANGPLNSEGRLVALKTDSIWNRLGDPDLFEDALRIDHPPFAHNSGMGWRALRADEFEALGVTGGDEPRRQDADTTKESELLPAPEKSTRGMDRDIAAELIRRIKARRGNKPGHVRYSERLEREIQKAEDAGVIEPKGGVAA